MHCLRWMAFTGCSHDCVKMQFHNTLASAAKPAHEVLSHHSHSLPATAAPTSLCATPEPCLCDWWQGHMRTWVTNRSGLWITPPKIQGIIFNLERFKDMVYGVMPRAVLVTQLVWWQAETMGWKQEGRGRKSSSQLCCHAQWNEAIWQSLKNLVLSAVPFGILIWVL